MHLKWRRLRWAKKVAIQRLSRQQRLITYAFQCYLRNRIDASRVWFQESDALRRVRSARFMRLSECHRRREIDDEVYGETDGETIWIDPRLTKEQMAATLVHEALHDSVVLDCCTRAGPVKYLSADDEHIVMYQLATVIN